MSKLYPVSMLNEEGVEWTPGMLEEWRKANKTFLFKDSKELNWAKLLFKLFLPSVIYTLLVFFAPEVASWLGCVFFIVQLGALVLLVVGLWMYALTAQYEELKKEIG